MTYQQITERLAQLNHHPTGSARAVGEFDRPQSNQYHHSLSQSNRQKR